MNTSFIKQHEEPLKVHQTLGVICVGKFCWMVLNTDTPLFEAGGVHVNERPHSSLFGLPVSVNDDSTHETPCSPCLFNPLGTDKTMNPYP